MKRRLSQSLFREISQRGLPEGAQRWTCSPQRLKKWLFVVRAWGDGSGGCNGSEACEGGGFLRLRGGEGGGQ